MTTPLLEMREIVKSFFGVRVLDHVSLDLYMGEVLALLGQNGAGKSTLIKILNGDYTADEGSILLDGQPVQIRKPRDAEHLGIRMIYQELHYAADLSVAENLLLGHLPRRAGALGRVFVDWKATYANAQKYLELLQVDISPKAPMRELSVVEREIVEITKALAGQARIIVMDEPTAALTPLEVNRLFAIIQNLRQQGVAIIYISHRLDEIFKIAQRVTVLRDGKHVSTGRVEDMDHRELVQLMVGHAIEQIARRPAAAHAQDGRNVLSVRGLTREPAFTDVSLDVKAGEIVGIFGLLGAGHANLTRAIFGAEAVDSGQVIVNNEQATIHSPRDAKRAGIGFVPIDRKVQGLTLDMNVRENVTLSNWGAVSRLGFFQGGKEREETQHWIDQLGIRMAGGMKTKTRFLSGGNQQKVVLARWLEANVKVLLLNEPTWGVDVGARADIYAQLETFAEDGLALLVVSSDVQEVLSLCHRILTMYRGRITAEFMQSDATEEILLHAASGGEA